MRKQGRHKWSVSGSLLNGSLIGIAAGALHHVYHAVTNDIPENIYSHVIGELVAAALLCAGLFVGIATLRNWLKSL
jgi:hypothetical protein